MTEGVALYLRVSTEDQDLDGQERELCAYAVRGWIVVATYREKVSASGRVERAQFEQLRKDACFAATRGFDHVLVWSLDRWSRDPSFVRAVGSIEELEVLGVQFHSFKESQLDSTPDGVPNLGRDLLRAILPTIASFEARRRSERTRLAMQEISSGRRATRSGRPPGRPRKVQPRHVALIQELRSRAPPLRWSQIARSVQLPASTCRKVWSALQSEKPRVEKGAGGFRTAEGAPREPPRPA